MVKARSDRKYLQFGSTSAAEKVLRRSLEVSQATKLMSDLALGRFDFHSFELIFNAVSNEFFNTAISRRCGSLFGTIKKLWFYGDF